MTEPPTIDTDVVPGSALDDIRRDSGTRRKFMRMSGRTAGGAVAAASLAGVLAACGDDGDSAMSTTPTTSTASAAADLEIVNYALTLEYIEADFYDRVIESGLFKGKVLSTLKSFGEHERAHVTALEKTAKSLGTPAEKPMTTFPLDSAKQVSELAATVENVGAAAYLGAAGKIKSPEILAAALSIHSIEARHASVLGRLVGKSTTPDGAFAKPMAMKDVLAAVKPFIQQ
ncbi:MAG: ferritin-like domain-containing protein [Baekduia sp.]